MCHLEGSMNYECSDFVFGFVCHCIYIYIHILTESTNYSFVEKEGFIQQLQDNLLLSIRPLLT